MPRPSSVTAKVYADTYATRAIVIEMLRLLQASNSSIVSALREALSLNMALRPADMAIPDRDIRYDAEMILDEV